MTDLRELQKVATQLRELQRTSPSTVAGIGAWDASARKFLESVTVPLPSQVMHYMHDADLRIKEPGYRKVQDEEITKIISDLEAGILSVPTGVTFSFHPRWLGAFALCVIAVICWALLR